MPEPIMNHEEQETLLQTIRARLERIDDRCGDISVMWIADENGPWHIIPFDHKGNGVYQYFIPAYDSVKFDKFGNQIENNETKTNH